MSEQEMIARIDAAIALETSNLPHAASCETIEILRLCRTTLASRTPEGMVMVPRETLIAEYNATYCGGMGGASEAFLRRFLEWQDARALAPTPSGAE